MFIRNPRPDRYIVHANSVVAQDIAQAHRHAVTAAALQVTRLVVDQVIAHLGNHVTTSELVTTGSKTNLITSQLLLRKLWFGRPLLLGAVMRKWVSFQVPNEL